MSTFKRSVVFSKWPIHDATENQASSVKDPFKVQNKPINVNITEYKKFTEFEIPHYN